MHDVITEPSTELTPGDSPADAESSRAPEEGSNRGIPQDLITPREVAALFSVNPKTVTRWAVAGRLTAYRTLGGHRRFSRAEIEQLLRVYPKAG